MSNAARNRRSGQRCEARRGTGVPGGDVRRGEEPAFRAASCEETGMENYIITISRRFASKGHEIAGLMGSELGIPVYDRSAVEARVQSLQTEYSLAEAGRERGREAAGAGSRKEKARYKRLFRRDAHDELRDEAQLEFERQSEVIRSLVAEGSCIILGRCADQLFENHPRALHVFIYASDEERIRNTMELLHTGEEEARSLVQNEDRTREAYRRRFSPHPEDEVAGRHILLDSGKLGARKCADILVQTVKYLFFE